MSMNGKFIGSILSLFVLAGIIISTGSGPNINTNVNEKSIVENTLSAESVPAGTETISTQTSTGAAASGSKISGEILSCTNITDSEHVIDIKLRNLDVVTRLISINPLSTTTELQPNQIKRIDLLLPNGISTLNIVSSNEEKLELQVPPCISRGGSDSSSSISASDLPPPPVPELSTLTLTGIGMLGIMFIIRGRKQ